MNSSLTFTLQIQWICVSSLRHRLFYVVAVMAQVFMDAALHSLHMLNTPYLCPQGADWGWLEGEGQVAELAFITFAWCYSSQLATASREHVS